MTIKPYHTHGKDDYGTPGPLYEALDQEFHFTLDVCADAENTKCGQYLTKEMDALSIDWWGRVFMNPPFSLLGKFLAKLIKELVAGHIEMGVALVAARSDTQAMFTASCYAGETRFLKGRVSYLVYPTEWQRAACETLNGVQIDPEAWPGLVKNFQLPKTTILALIKDPYIPGGHPSLSIGAPFPSTVLVFDRRAQQKTVYWDWKQGVKTSYVFQGTQVKSFLPKLEVIQKNFLNKYTDEWGPNGKMPPTPTVPEPISLIDMLKMANLVEEHAPSPKQLGYIMGIEAPKDFEGAPPIQSPFVYDDVLPTDEE